MSNSSSTAAAAAWRPPDDVERGGGGDDPILLSAAARKRLDGFPSLAEFIARDPDAAIYRRFNHLSARNLLYLQSELHSLESELRALDEADARDRRNEARRAARKWDHHADPANPSGVLHTQLQDRIRAKLREYHETLVLESQVLALPGPSSRTLRAFSRWFNHKTPVLMGRDEGLYDDQQDLVALAPQDTDRLNILLQTYFGWLFQVKAADSGDAAGRSEHLFYYRQHHIQLAGRVVSVILSAVLLLGAIVSLLVCSESSSAFRVGVIVLFTCLFAAVVGLLTSARRAELFGATAA